MNPPAAIKVLRTERPEALPAFQRRELASMDFDYYDRYTSHPGHSLTPSKLLAIYRQAEDGWPRLQCELFDDIRQRDAHLHSQFAIRIQAVAGKTWLVQAGGDDDRDIKAAKLLEEKLRLVPRLRRGFKHLLRHIIYGWSGAEIYWDYRDDVVVPTWIETVAQKRFVFDDLGRPRLTTTKNRVDGEMLAPGRWLYVEGEEDCTPASGLMRVAAWWSLFKSMSVRDWVVFNERFGLPFPIGKYNEETNKEERDNLRVAVRSLGKDAHAIMHESCSIESVKFEMSGTPDDVHNPFVQFCNAEISKLITGGTLVSGEGQSGSYGLGAVHENVLFGATCDDAEELADAFSEQIGKPFVEWNGLDAKPPRLKLHVVKEQSATERMAIFTGFVGLGGKVDADQVRQEFQIKAPTGETLSGALKAATPGAPVPAAKPAPPAVPTADT